MTATTIAHTALRDRAAGEALSRQIQEGFHGARPDALIVFASPGNDHQALLTAIAEGCAPALMIGCSSAGEFTSEVAGEGLSCAVALGSSEMRFTAVLARGIAADHKAVAQELVAGFGGLEQHGYRYRTPLALLDALAGHA